MRDRIIFCAFSFVERLLIDDITIRSCEKNIIAILSCLRSCFSVFFPLPVSIPFFLFMSVCTVWNVYLSFFSSLSFV